MKRSKHNLSHYRLASFDMGQLVPVGCVEVLPGDTFRHSSSVLLRVGTLATPVMHPVSVRVHHWYCPSRMLLDQFHNGTHGAWEDFMNGSGAATIKDMSLTTEDVTAGTLANHLGIPVGVEDMNVNSLPFWAYQVIWSQFYRDQDLGTEITPSTAEADLKTLKRVCWEKDYFSSCRPYPQFGDTTMSIPFAAGSEAPITGIGFQGTTTTVLTSQQVRGVGGTTPTYPFAVEADSHAVGTAEVLIQGDSDAEASVNPVIYADLANAEGGIDVNEFRRAIALQKFLEARSRFGSRYRDYLRYLGVRSSDGRLEEPEYLGGGKQTVAFSEVLVTAEGTATEVGDMAGHGIAALRTRPYTRFFEEHGFVLSLISVRPKAMYMNSINRHWLRSTKDDFWQKEYEMFGPQAVSTKEVYAPHANETDVFGYQDRFREYREHPSYVSGLFNTTDDDWHMAREFASAPSLNSSFVECTPTDRVYADANAPELRAMINHRITARRLVSKNAR